MGSGWGEGPVTMQRINLDTGGCLKFDAPTHQPGFAATILAGKEPSA